ncbi:hypothetical protein PINS_up020548 [Pythium insidiosum]|nr:hypothetical protein PINS_up020548 [Pythium insidiosum]
MSERMAELHHVKEQLRGKQQELGSLNAEKRTLASKLKQLGSHPIASATDVNEADKLVEEAQREIESFKANNDVVALKNAIQAIGKNVHDANYEIEQLDSKITVLRLQERDYISLEMKRTELKKKEEEFVAKVAGKASQLKALTGIDIHNETTLQEASRAADNVSSQYKDIVVNSRRELAVAEAAVRDNETASNRIEESLATLRSEKNELERGQIGELKRLVEDILPGEDIKNADVALQKAQQVYFDAKDKTLRCKNTITFLGIFKQKGVKDKCCPLCMRDMTPEEEQVFISTINEKTDDRKVKEKIKKAESQEALALKKWKGIEASMPALQQWFRLEEEIPRKMTALEEQYTAKRTLQADVKEKKHSLMKAEKMLEDIEQEKVELSTLLVFADELQRSRIKFQSDEERLRSSKLQGGHDQTLSEVETTRDSKQAEVHEWNRQLARKNTELQQLQDMQQQLQNNLHNRQQEKLRLDQRRAESQQLADEQNRLREQEQQLRAQIAELTNTEPRLKKEVRVKEEELIAHRNSSDARILKHQEQLEPMVADCSRFTDLFERVQEHRNQNLNVELQRLSDEIAKTKEKQRSAAQYLEEISPEIASLQKAVDDQQSLKRQIRDNLEYREWKRDLENIRAEMDRTRQKISALPSLSHVEDRLRRAREAVTSAREKRATVGGRQDELEVQIRDYKVQLRQADLRNVEEQQRDRLIEYETTKMAVADLDTYATALDRSLLQYHSKKVEEINSIIRSLWQITYKGQDIDTIELVSSEESETGTSKATKSYHYRVVMKKGGALVDMRGRCSAGQKVLAALVIRLALAETFCPELWHSCPRRANHKPRHREQIRSCSCDQRHYQCSSWPAKFPTGMYYSR